MAALKARLEKKKRQLDEKRKQEKRGRIISGKGGTSCPDCKLLFTNRKNFLSHLEMEHHPQLSSDAEYKYQKIHSVFQGAKVIYRLSPPPGSITDALMLFRADSDNGEDVLKYELIKNKVISFMFSATVRMYQLDKEGNRVSEEDISFPCPKRPLFLEHYKLISKILDEVRLHLATRVSEFTENNGSGFIVDYVKFADISIFEGTLTFSGSASPYKLTKKEVANYLKSNFSNVHQAFEPVSSYSNDCLIFSISQFFAGAHFHAKTGKRKKKKLCSRDELKRFIEEKGLKNSIGSPPELMKLKKLEDENSHLSFRLNVHMYDEGQGVVFPYIRSEKSMSDVKHSIDVLLFDVGDLAHFVLISKLHMIRPINASTDSANEEKKKRTTFCCPFCYSSHSTRKALINHEEVCSRQGLQKITLPPPGSKKYFKDVQKRVPVDIFGAFDFETKMTRDMSGFQSSESNKLEEQMEAVTFSMAFVDVKGNLLFHRTHSSDTDCLPAFFDALYDAKQKLLPLLNRYPTHGLSSEECYEMKKKADKCYICNGPFPFSLEEEKEIVRLCSKKKRGREGSSSEEEGTDSSEEEEEEEMSEEQCDVFTLHFMEKIRKRCKRLKKKGRDMSLFLERTKKWANPICFIRVVDHSHYFGGEEPRGISHSACNLKSNRRGQLISLYAHNLTAFDGHLVLQGIGEQVKRGFNLKQMRLGGLCLNTEKLRTIRYDIFKFVDSCSFMDSSLDNIVSDLKAGGYSFPLLLSSGLAANEEEKRLLTRKGIFPYSAYSSASHFKNQTQLSPKAAFYNDLTGQHIRDEDYAHAQNVFRTFGCKNMLEYAERYCFLDVILLLESIFQLRLTIFNTFQLELCSYISLPQLAQDAIFATSGCTADIISDKRIFDDIDSQLRGGFSYVKTRLQERESDQQLLYLDVNNLYGESHLAIIIFLKKI